MIQYIDFALTIEDFVGGDEGDNTYIMHIIATSLYKAIEHLNDRDNIIEVHSSPVQISNLDAFTFEDANNDGILRAQVKGFIIEYGYIERGNNVKPYSSDNIVASDLNEALLFYNGNIPEITKIDRYCATLIK